MIRTYIENEDGRLPELANLSSWWEAIPPDAPDPEFPDYSARVVLLSIYLSFTYTSAGLETG